MRGREGGEQGRDEEVQRKAEKERGLETMSHEEQLGDLEVFSLISGMI